MPAAPALEHLTLNNRFQDLALSPDGRKVAFVARGEVWAASAKDGGDAVRVTRIDARESQIGWSPDSRRIVYVSERDGVAHLFLYDFATQQGNAADERRDRRRGAARLAGRQVVAFVRDGKELRVLDLAAKTGAVAGDGISQPVDRAARVVARQPLARVPRR